MLTDTASFRFEESVGQKGSSPARVGRSAGEKAGAISPAQEGGAHPALAAEAAFGFGAKGVA
jgi:hypothetical protein